MHADHGRVVLLGVRELDGDELRPAVIAVRLDDQVRDTPFRRIDDDVGEFPEGPVRAVHLAAEFQTHDRPRSP
jgi:hypothetical protein